MKRYACSCFSDLDRHTVHQFRVEYKKLRAFLRMLSANESIEVSGKLRRAYRIAGRIRDFQLHMAGSGKSTDDGDDKPAAYLKALRREIHKEKAALIKILSTNPLDKSQAKTDHMLPGSFTMEEYQRYTEGKQRKINAILRSAKFNNQNLHVIRKILKDLVYNSDTCASAFPGKASFTMGAVFSSLLDDLGIFQDQCSSIKFMKGRLVRALRCKDKRKMAVVKRHLLRSRKRLKYAIIKKLRAAVNPDPVRSVSIKQPARVQIER
ncbi:CHAD domain-containing protein [Chitinophaga sedimenti]|nr:CHAD domain-containing protein [Chitinophaga sedimenti]